MRCSIVRPARIFSSVNTFLMFKYQTIYSFWLIALFSKSPDKTDRKKLFEHHGWTEHTHNSRDFLKLLKDPFKID